MSKKESANAVVENEVKNTEEEASPLSWKEIRENLTMQLKNHLEQIKIKGQEIEHHTTMANKAQGAIEVGDQMHPEEVEQEETK